MRNVLKNCLDRWCDTTFSSYNGILTQSSLNLEIEHKTFLHMCGNVLYPGYVAMGTQVDKIP